MTPNTRPAEDEAVERATEAVRGQGWTQTYGLDSRGEVAEQIARAALEAAGYFALRDERDALQRFKEYVHGRLDVAGVPAMQGAVSADGSTCC
jgi:hypothetical protein